MHIILKLYLTHTRNINYSNRSGKIPTKKKPTAKSNLYVQKQNLLEQWSYSQQYFYKNNWIWDKSNGI